MNDQLMQLSEKAFIKLGNKFTGFFACPETINWTLEIEHVTFRGRIVKFIGNDLSLLLKQAIQDMKEYEKTIEKRKQALQILHPELDEYDIAELERNGRKEGIEIKYE